MTLRSLLLAATCALAGCSILGSPQETLPTIKVTGHDPGKTLLIVLPGFAFDADDLQDKGVAQAVHRGWPEPDVLLVGATFPYYRSGTLVPKLHEQVIAPARAQGYREIWLAGGSMGGMGVLLYEWHHPGELTGLVLLSPFLGDEDVLDEVRESGLARWDPGELSPQMDGDNFSRHVWNMIKGWRSRPELPRRVWLACGTEDRLYADSQLLAREIPSAQYLVAPGAHNWAYWIPAIEDVFRRIAQSRR